MRTPVFNLVRVGIILLLLLAIPDGLLELAGFPASLRVRQPREQQLDLVLGELEASGLEVSLRRTTVRLPFLITSPILALRFTR